MTAASSIKRRITMVEKINTDGSPCRKCAEVAAFLQRDGYIDRIDQIVIADERDKNSAGVVLAKQHGVERAPFFIVENADGSVLIYTVYLKFVKEIFAGKPTQAEELSDLLDSAPDIDYI